MDADYYKEEMARERRARLAAERLLEQKQAELKATHHKLSQHAIALSGQIVDQRKILEQLQGETSEATNSALKANHKALAAERLLWDAVKSIEDGFAVFDKDRKLIAANAPYLNLFKRAENVGPGVSLESILELCIADDLIDREGKSEDDWYDFMLDRLEVEEIKPVILKLTNGIYVKLTDRRTSDGGIVSLALNITDTIEREVELRDARDEALAGERAKSAFLAKMSHELRTPINGVLGMADLLSDHDMDEEMQLYVDTIKSSGSTILSVVSNVLEFAMLEAQQVELAAQPFALREVLSEVHSAALELIDDKPVNLTFAADPKLPKQVIGDAKRLKQVLTNLLTNAVGFTETGQITLRCELQNPASDDVAKLKISVEDTGVGIAPEFLGHIFGGFNQADDNMSRSYEGAGLGLSIAKKLVEAMNGELLVASKVGEGSVFDVLIALPKVQEETTSKQSADNAADGPLRTRVLAAEDNKTNQLVFKKMIKDLDIDLIMVANGIEAVEAYKEQRPHMIFMDISMPKMDGMEATQQIRWHETEHGLDPITIVAMTAHAMEGDEVRIKNSGLNEYLTKPLSKASIVQMVQEYGIKPASGAQAS